MECVRSKSVGYVGARRIMTATLEEPLRGVLFCEGCVVAASESNNRCRLEYVVATMG